MWKKWAWILLLGTVAHRSFSLINVHLQTPTIPIYWCMQRTCSDTWVKCNFSSKEHPHSRHFRTCVETLYVFVQPSAQCLPLSKLLGFLWAVSKSDSISPRSHMATLQLSAPVKPFAMWERSALFMDTHLHMHLHTYFCIWLIHFAGAYRPPTAWFILASKSEHSELL